MEHHFKIEDAQKYGIEKAVLLYNLNFWLEKNRVNNTNKHKKNGVTYWWTYNSANAFSELFPYMSLSSISRWLKELESDGIIISGSFNKHKYDRTKWFTTNSYIDKSIAQTEQDIAQIEVTIPDNNTDSKTQIINTDVSSLITLPIIRGKSPTARVFSIYCSLFLDKFGMGYKGSVPMAMKQVKDLLVSYTELQLAMLLIIYFEWKGMSGDNFKDQEYLCNVAFPPTMFRSQISKYEIYARNVMNLDFDNDEKLLPLVGKHISQLTGNSLIKPPEQVGKYPESFTSQEQQNTNEDIK